MRAGYRSADITPLRPMPLSGFAARCDADLTGVDDPLVVRALAVEHDGRRVVILSYDLLAIGRELHERIRSALGAQFGDAVDWVLCATHTHSAPAAITLLGCGTAQPDYWHMVVGRSVEAARQALDSLRPATLRWSTVALRGHSYNRRAVLEDGRVSMARQPAGRVLKRGPVWERALLVRFEDDHGRGVAGILAWACHPDTVCGPSVSADFPGELCRRLAELHGVPFLFLQGAGGDLNPFFHDMTRAEMLANVERLMPTLTRAEWTAAAEGVEAWGFARCDVDLDYGPLPAPAELRDMSQKMDGIARTGNGPDRMMVILADILNVPPGQRPERRMATHIAGVLRDWARRVLPIAERGEAEACPLGLAAWRLNRLVFCFVAGEAFAETAFRLQEAFRDDVVTTVAYASPLVGYLPTDQAIHEGGYEVAYAHRFYGHPARFAEGTEARVVSALTKMVRRVS